MAQIYNTRTTYADGTTWTRSETSMKLDLKERDLFKEDEIKQKKLRKQIEKDNTGLEGRCRYARIGPIELNRKTQYPSITCGPGIIGQVPFTLSSKSLCTSRALRYLK
ncbi:hypothetical protein PF003_g8558 [Phytophthora fragariae]|nr:hypothetical protein PF003_g8558 [Phytophthora fragariae]